MEAAKDLLRRAVELDAASRYSEALVCYEQGIQNLLRAMGGERAPLGRLTALFSLTPPFLPAPPGPCRVQHRL